MVAQRYRWDFIGLSSQAKPTKATSDKVTNGSTYYESDTSKLYVFYGNQWYEKTAPGGGGGTSDFDQLSNRPKYNGTAMTHETNIPEVITYSNFTGTDGVDPGTAGLVPAPATTDAGKFLKADGTWDSAGGGSSVNVVQTTGNSQTDVMSQDAASSMVFADPGTDTKIKIGSSTILDSNNSIAIGYGAGVTGSSSFRSVVIGNNAGSVRQDAVALGALAKVSSTGDFGVAIGRSADCSKNGAVALGAYSSPSSTGEVNIGTSESSYGYNSSNYRLLSGVYDGQDSHDAVTVSQINGVIDAINTALNINLSHIGASS